MQDVDYGQPSLCKRETEGRWKPSDSAKHTQQFLADLGLSSSLVQDGASVSTTHFPYSTWKIYCGPTNEETENYSTICDPYRKNHSNRNVAVFFFLLFAAKGIISFHLLSHALLLFKDMTGFPNPIHFAPQT